jgi:hypothetical protein
MQYVNNTKHIYEFSYFSNRPDGIKLCYCGKFFYCRWIPLAPIGIGPGNICRVWLFSKNNNKQVNTRERQWHRATHHPIAPIPPHAQPKISFRTNVNAKQLYNNDMLLRAHTIRIYVYIIIAAIWMTHVLISHHQAQPVRITSWLAGWCSQQDDRISSVWGLNS